MRLHKVHTMKDKQQKQVVSLEKLAANRKNAKRSTGPRTAEGKQRSSQNAYKHGFYSDRIFPTPELWARDGEGYGRKLAAYRNHYAPIGELENDCVEQMAMYSLRQVRILGPEQKVLNQPAPFELRSVDRIVRYESHISRLLEKAIARLERLQAARQAESSELDSSNLEEDEALSNDDAIEEPQDASTSSSVPDASPTTAPQHVEIGAQQESPRVDGEQPNEPADCPSGSAQAIVTTGQDN
jgi:hypothetical protein